MHIDWTDCHQDFDYPLPLIGKTGYQSVDLATGEVSPIRGARLSHEGSYSTKMTIKVNGNRLSVSCNPSAFDRLDNLFGYTSIDDCMQVINYVLHSLGLPAFTKCTCVWYLAGEDGSKVTTVSDGCVFERLDFTSNIATGQGNDKPYIRALSSLPYGNAVPRLFSNGNTVDWVNKNGKVMQDQYAKAYGKSSHMREFILFKAIRRYGADSPEVNYLNSIINYCDSHGVVRFEQSLKSGFLRKNNLAFWGLSDFSIVDSIHQKFLTLDSKLQVTAMDTQTISELLISKGIVTSTHSANVTAMYALNWAHGFNFEFHKKQVKTHRARLRQVGIDIALPFDLTKFSVVTVKNVREVSPQPLAVPVWYQMPSVPQIKRAA